MSVIDLSVTYATEAGLVRAVRGISFDIARGETFAIVGESGSGKSTVALSLLGLLPRAGAMAGRVTWESDATSLFDERSLRSIRGKEIGIVFQDPAAYLNPVLTIGEQIGEMLWHHRRLRAAAARKETLELLNMVGIPNAAGRVDDYPHQFSGGMRQRALLAMALSCRPKLLIADEPTTALDVTIAAQILDLIADLQAELGMSLLLITHDLGVVARLADRVAVMYGGLLMELGDSRVVLGSPTHPYTRGLLDSLPRLREPVAERLHSIEGSPPGLIDPPHGCPFQPRCAYRIAKCVDQPPLFVDSYNRATACWVTGQPASKAAHGA